MDSSDAKRLRDLEAENSKLKRLLAEAHLDIHALKGVFGVKR
jgi:putative transposase